MVYSHALETEGRVKLLARDYERDNTLEFLQFKSELCRGSSAEGAPQRPTPAIISRKPPTRPSLATPPAVPPRELGYMAQCATPPPLPPRKPGTARCAPPLPPRELRDATNCEMPTTAPPAPPTRSSRFQFLVARLLNNIMPPPLAPPVHSAVR
jgi:hypothetical protein